MTCSTSPDCLDYDPLALACDELNWCRACGVRPLRWNLGAEASAYLAIKQFPGNSMAIESMGIRVTLLLGLPVSIDPDLDLRAVKLICEESGFNPLPL